MNESILLGFCLCSLVPNSVELGLVSGNRFGGSFVNLLREPCVEGTSIFDIYDQLSEYCVVSNVCAYLWEMLSRCAEINVNCLKRTIR